MKYVDTVVSPRQLEVLKYIFDVGIASSSEIMTKAKTSVFMINKLLENELVKYIHSNGECYYYVCQDGFDMITSNMDEYFNYGDYIECSQEQIHGLLLDEFKREVKSLEDDYPAVFKPFSIQYAREAVKPLYSLEIDGLIYLIEAEESMRSEFMYTKKFREYAKQFKLQACLPHGIIILKGNIANTNKSIISNEQLDFRYIFNIFQQELGELANDIRLLYLTPSEFRQHVAFLLHHNKLENKVVEDIHRNIDQEQVSASEVPIWKIKNIDRIDNELNYQDGLLPIFNEDNVLVATIKEENRAKIFVWRHQKALQVFINNQALYILLQRCEGFDSKPWVKGVNLFKAFSEEFPNSKVICYFQMTLFEPYRNKLDVLSSDNQDIIKYYDAMYLMDLRERPVENSLSGISYWRQESIKSLILKDYKEVY